MALWPFRGFQRFRDPAVQAAALHNCGVALSSAARYQRALDWFERALVIDPGFADSHCGCGTALAAMDRHNQALACFERALTLRPEFLNARYGQAVSLTALNRHGEAIACYDQVLARQPDHVAALYARSLSLLASGDLAHGLEGFEFRQRLPSYQNASCFRFSSPSWRGDTQLAGKTIILCPDGGLGDAIQFVRFAPLLAQRDARILVRVPAKLRALLSEARGVDEVVATGEPLPPHDWHCPMFRLPLVLGTTLDTIPAAPYLRTNGELAAAWGQRLGPRHRPRVGIAWAGSNNFPDYERRRSVRLELLRPLTNLDCDLISLQRPIPKPDRAALQAMPSINRLGESLTDFAEIAAVIENLDLVIAIDSSIAHLAGALGKPVWLLLCFAPDWRWLTDRTDSPWYPTARLFRQKTPTPGEWGAVIEDVVAAWRDGFRDQSLASGTRSI